MMSTSNKTDFDNINSSELKELTNSLPLLSDKVIVDLVNGMDVIRDHIFELKKPVGFPGRIVDLVLGNDKKRNISIYENLSTSIDATTIWLGNIEKWKIGSDFALVSVAKKLVDTRNKVRTLTSKSETISSKITQLESHFNDIFSVIQNEQLQLKQRLDAKDSLDFVMSKWKGGGYDVFISPLNQMFVALEELFWSPFGEYAKNDPKYIEHLKYQCVTQLLHLIGTKSADKLIPIDELFTIEPTKNILMNSSNDLLFEGGAANDEFPITSYFLESIKHGRIDDFSSFETTPRVTSINRISEKVAFETRRRLYG